MYTCRDVARLLYDYAERLISVADQQGVDKHMVGCPACEAFLKTYQDTIHRSRHLRCDEIPDEVSQRLKAFLQSKQQNKSSDNGAQHDV